MSNLSPSVRYPVCDISSSCLRRSDDLHDLPFADAKVPRNRVLTLNLGQLALLCPVALEQLRLLRVREHHMLGYQFMVRDVDEQFLLLEDFKVVRRIACQRL